MALSKEERELERARKAYEWGYADGQKGRHSLVNHVNVSAAWGLDYEEGYQDGYADHQRELLNEVDWADWSWIEV